MPVPDKIDCEDDSAVTADVVSTIVEPVVNAIASIEDVGLTPAPVRNFILQQLKAEKVQVIKLKRKKNGNETEVIRKYKVPDNEARLKCLELLLKAAGLLQPNKKTKTEPESKPKPGNGSDAVRERLQLQQEAAKRMPAVPDEDITLQ